jgi:hypothetical protein
MRIASPPTANDYGDAECFFFSDSCSPSPSVRTPSAGKLSLRPCNEGWFRAGFTGKPTSPAWRLVGLGSGSGSGTLE